MRIRAIGAVLAVLLAAAVGGSLAGPAAAACVDGAACPATAAAPDAEPSSGAARPFKTETMDAAVAPARKAATLRWNFRNQSGRRVEFQLYSQRRNWVWPRANRVYVLPDARLYVTDISCQPNEKICFGAWVAGNTNRFWGVGYSNSQSCPNCCYICGGGQTRLIRLLP